MGSLLRTVALKVIVERGRVSVESMVTCSTVGSARTFEEDIENIKIITAAKSSVDLMYVFTRI